MREMTLDESKRIQIEMLRELDVFCRTNGIKYSIAYGTLIGAVRHKGFIPWDDDIDVVMLRSDFERFLSTFNSKKFELLKPMRQIRWEFFARIVDPNTYVKFEKFPESPFGVWLTIFPVDTRPDDESEWLKQKKKIDSHATLARFKCTVLTQNRVRNFFKKISHILAAPLSLNRINEKVLKYASEYEGKKTSKKIIWISFNNYETHPSSVFDGYMDMQFEDLTVQAMIGYDTFLRDVYGDYMQLPPKEKQQPHHGATPYYLND